ncbi:MAG: GIY-YIG nuclease family protein [Oceanicaulis sp.]|uniref:GIY-YIG nuclease family protein n=1 Tax=Glycocaulis sp. TaxID=1969725 RepID=UPI0025C45932|nr:GIY-YIG nuclease family protein [Glycocaulis sp.]MCC5980160.1 GIY-YIG nuclease family protein [Oceanicaulis sp.]MCH8521952.1 GIY-YIG nuclease family protein [Glycocaulis sp.]
MTDRNPDDINFPPFETEDLRSNLTKFLATPFDDPILGYARSVGSFTWGVYAFFDYDGEPIYVGQTKEKISTRIRRHLTNQRTDAVAMSVLDPFEVFEVEVWPLPQFERASKTDAAAKANLDALEHFVYEQSVARSTFKAILNEKNPPKPTVTVAAPPSLRFRLVSEEVHKIRSHPDFRIARRSLIISRLAQVISERKVQGGLRRVLLTQAKRLQWLAERRYVALGGEASVELEDGKNSDD